MPKPRKTIAQHVADGTFRKDRHGGKAIPTLTDSVPNPPGTLIPAAHKYWYSEAKAALSIRLLSEKDYAALEILAYTMWLRQEAADDIKARGISYQTDKGIWQRNPSLTTLEKANSQILQLQKEFGLTPLAAQRINAPEEEKGVGDPRNDIFGGAAK